MVTNDLSSWVKQGIKTASSQYLIRSLLGQNGEKMTILLV